ncbi:beta-lactamase family protein [Streptomyces sp. G44]|uniref:serine hydrolase domain-containing protein n=1 Tax=Streptomyces sp. G44 TaxID=2807632 RepID=UPI0019619FB9|nr:serine hydrolase domain-containing protein [Streptomyces sp. G44]MBM7168487.1 beta-lactamase family protein [Streptomyces sp. G44]
MREQARQKTRPTGRRGARHRVAAAAAAIVSAFGVVAAGTPQVPAVAASRPDAVRQGLDTLVRVDGMPGALVSVTDREGRDRAYTAGVGDLATGAPVPRDGQVRIGSNTKTFTAVVMLQLVAEKKVSLDAPVDTYLPDVVRGEGIDGRRITVRHLLQQTSGLPNYTEYDIRPRYYAPRELLDIALRHKGHFAPGKKWEYSNTNYVLAGLIIEKVTRHTVAQEMRRRVIEPLGLRHTYFPAPHDATIREPHPQGYHRETPGAPPADITETDPSWAWSAGQLISTNSDLNRFFTALLAGRLLPAPQLAQMRTTVRAPYFGDGARYGLGIVSRPLSCGGRSWGHGGSFPGYETRGGVTDDGRAANVAVTMQPTAEATGKRLESVVDTALCR